MCVCVECVDVIKYVHREKRHRYTVVSMYLFVHSSCGCDIGSWFSTDMHQDNYEIQKNSTKFNFICVPLRACVTYGRRKLFLFQT